MARVAQKAPHWEGTALRDDDFEELSMDQYRGVCDAGWLPLPLPPFTFLSPPSLSAAGHYLVLFFYPNDL